MQFLYLQCNELNRGHPTFFVAPFSKYLVAFSLMEMNFSPQVPHLGLVRYERTPILLFWTRLVIGRKTLGGPGRVRYTVNLCVNLRLTSTYFDLLQQIIDLLANAESRHFFNLVVNYSTPFGKLGARLAEAQFLESLFTVYKAIHLKLNLFCHVIG